MSDTKQTSIHGQWSSRLAFILAATGSAVGLGNIWKFPYITGEYGGGAFVFVYLICICVIGIPIMMAEIMLGRRGRQSPINTMRSLAQAAKANRLWVLLGWAGVLAGFIILSYYSVIAGWALAYVFRTGAGVFSGVTADGSAAIFTALVSDPERLVAWHTLFMVMTTVVVARGVTSGLEKATRILMPVLFILLIIMVGFAMNTDKFIEGLEYLFTPDFEKLFYPNCTEQRCEFSSGGILTALGHSFFTLSLGMGAIMVYGSYLPKGASIAQTTFAVAIMDTLVALVAGMAIFPIVFASGLEPGAGPGLIFQTLPIAFGNMAGGTFFGTLFFILLVFAAWTSAISLIEPAVAWLVENMNMPRVTAASIACGLTWLLGLVTVMSFSDWAFSFHFAGDEKTNGFFDIFDILTANIMLPLGGLFIAVFSAWVMRRESVVSELGMGEGIGFQTWYVLTRFVTPIGVLVIFFNAIGLF